MNLQRKPDRSFVRTSLDRASLLHSPSELGSLGDIREREANVTNSGKGNELRTRSSEQPPSVQIGVWSMAAFIDFLFQWQELIGGVIGGVFTVVAGALIFIEGGRQRLSRFAAEQVDMQEWLQLLRERCAELTRLIKEDRRSLKDCAEELARSDAKANLRELVPPDTFPKSAGMKIILQQLMARRTPYRVLLMLSELVELLDIYESDFDALRGAMLGEIREHRRPQQVLSFARVEPAWQKAYSTMELATVRVRGKLREINDLLGTDVLRGSATIHDGENQ